MSETSDQPTTYAQVNERLKEIVEQVSDDDMPLDDALGLFEEAVKLGMRASDMLEQDIEQREEADDASEDDTTAEQTVDDTASSTAEDQ